MLSKDNRLHDEGHSNRDLYRLAAADIALLCIVIGLIWVLVR